MKTFETIDFCRAEANWTWSAIVVFSWLAFGAAIYFMAVQTGLMGFTYYPNEIGVISPTTIARIPKIARTFHFVAGTGFSALAGVVGWWLWLAFCSFLAARSGREPQKIFSVDALANLILLVTFADIMHKFSSYTTAAILCLVMLSSFRLALFLHVGKKRPNQN